MAAASNTMGCLRELRGRTIIGVMQAQFEGGEYGPTKILVLDDGTGFGFNSIGSYWRVPKNELAREIAAVRKDYERNGALLADVLEAAGAES